MNPMIAAARIVTCCLGLALAVVAVAAEQADVGSAERSDAWLTTADDAPDSTDEPDDWERMDAYGDLDGFDALAPIAETAGQLLSRQPQRPVSEPPPGYQLHKLRRSEGLP